MMPQAKELSRPLANAGATIEDMSRRVWEGKIGLATTAHTLGGVGLGLLAYHAISDRARLPVAYALLGASALMHLYAFFTAPERRTWEMPGVGGRYGEGI